MPFSEELKSKFHKRWYIRYYVGERRVCVSIAKLIAMCFIDNNKPEYVKFTDGDEHKYNASNLEWIKNTIKEPKSDEDKKHVKSI